jgi:hypothetical protein
MVSLILHITNFYVDAGQFLHVDDHTDLIFKTEKLVRKLQSYMLVG